MIKSDGNQIKGGIILTYINIGVQLLVSLLFTPIMLRIIGQSEFGLYNLAASVIAYLGILNFGFGSAYIRFYSRYKKVNSDKISQLNGMFLIIFFVLAIITIIAGLFLVKYAHILFGSKITVDEINTARILMLILIFNLAISFPATIFTSYISANERFIFLNIITLLKSITSPLITIPILLLGFGSIGMVIVTSSLNFLIIIVHFFYARKILALRISFSNFDVKLFHEMIIFSSFIFLNMVIDQINWNVDKYLIGRFHGTIPVAIYSVAALLNAQYLRLSTSISSVFIPRVHQIVQNQTNPNVQLTNLFIKVGRIQFQIVGLFLLGFIIFGKPFIVWWVGINYEKAYIILILLILPVTIPLIQNIGIEIQRAKNMHKFRSIIYFLIALVNIGITIPLTMKFQGVGAAFGTGLSFIIGTGLIMNIYYHRRVGLDIKQFWKEIAQIFPAFLPPIIFGGMFAYFFNIYELTFFLIGIILFTAIYLVSLWFISIKNQEKQLLIGVLQMFFKKFKKIK